MLLIDGYNVILRREVDSVDDARRLFLNELDAYCLLERKEAVVVFDRGRETLRRKETHSERVTAVYAAKGESADEVIVGMVRSTKDRTKYEVVSSDREIAAAARERKVKVTGADEFRKAMARRPRATREARQEGISPSEVDEWMRIFGFKEKK